MTAEISGISSVEFNEKLKEIISLIMLLSDFLMNFNRNFGILCTYLTLCEQNDLLIMLQTTWNVVEKQCDLRLCFTNNNWPQFPLLNWDILFYKIIHQLKVLTSSFCIFTVFLVKTKELNNLKNNKQFYQLRRTRASMILKVTDVMLERRQTYVIRVSQHCYYVRKTREQLRKLTARGRLCAAVAMLWITSEINYIF